MLQDFEYAGKPGQTRTEARADVDGGEVFRVVNVREHPHLRDAALRGALNPGANDVPFVYHDPDLRQYVLVLPAGAARHEFAARAELMNELVLEEHTAVPDYVRNFTVAFGAAELRQIVQGEAAWLPTTLRSKASELEEWSLALRAEDEALRQRMREVERREQMVSSIPPPLPVRPAPSSNGEIELDVVDVVAFDGDEECTVSSVVPAGDPNAEMVALEAVEELEADAGVELIETEDSQTGEVEAEEIDAQDVQIDDDPTDLAPDRLWQAPLDALQWDFVDEDVVIFARVSDRELENFHGQNTELLLQLQLASECPVALLTMFDAKRQSARRLALNPHDATDRGLLDALANEFTATAHVFCEDHTLLRTIHLQSPREDNVKALLRRAAEHECSAEQWRVAVADAPVLPIDTQTHPFFPEGSARNATGALQRLRRIEAWSDRIDELLLELSVPVPVYEQACTQALSDMLKFGLAGSDWSLDRAVELGLAAEHAELTRVLRDHFASTAELGGLGDRETSANWQRLKELSIRYGLSATKPAS